MFTPQVEALQKKKHVIVDGKRVGLELQKKSDLSFQHTTDRSSGCGSRFPSPTLNIDRAKSAVRRIMGRWRGLQKNAESQAREQVIILLPSVCIVFLSYVRARAR